MFTRSTPFHATLLRAAMAAAVTFAPVPAAAASLLISSGAATLLDPIGEGCLDYHPDDFDTPMPSKLVPEPFCVPEPCAAMLPRPVLANWIMGRDPADWEWDAYVSRYAQACVAEIPVPWTDADVIEAPVTPEEVFPSVEPPLFPLVSAAVVSAKPATAIVPATTTGSGPRGGSTPNGPLVSGGGDGNTPGPNPGPPPIITTEPQPPIFPHPSGPGSTIPAPVPLPATGLLLLAGIAALAGRSRVAIRPGWTTLPSTDG